MRFGLIGILITVRSHHFVGKTKGEQRILGFQGRCPQMRFGFFHKIGILIMVRPHRFVGKTKGEQRILGFQGTHTHKDVVSDTTQWVSRQVSPNAIWYLPQNWNPDNGTIPSFCRQDQRRTEDFRVSGYAYT